jgi:hypothetical protein
MADPMRMLGVGSRFSILALAVAMLAAASACSTRDGAEKSGGAEGEASAPEQVVQQMKAPPEPSTAAGPAVAREARASASVVSRANGASLAPRSNAVETITSKHLEAELNRLEAELAN